MLSGGSADEEMTMDKGTIAEVDQVVFETAEEHMVTRVPMATPEERVGAVRRSLEDRQFETLAAVAVIARGRLVGLIRIEELMAAPGDRLVRETMDPSPPIVGPGVDQEVAAWQAAQRGEPVLAVTGDQGRFRGLIPPERLLAVLLWEHDEDMARLGGFVHDAAAARGEPGASPPSILAPAPVADRRARWGAARHRDRWLFRRAAAQQHSPRLLHPGNRLHGRCRRHPD
jgi:Mg/Co/Ni transporter MgtE